MKHKFTPEEIDGFLTFLRGSTMRKWKMPEWMEPYRECIINTGGNRIEDMMNGNADPRINLPLSTLQACVKSQVGLLTILHTEGLLK